GQAHVTGDLLGVRETLDVAELEDEDDRDEGADAGDRGEALHARIAAPARDEFAVEPTDLRVERGQQGAAVLANPARGLGQEQVLQLALAALGEPALARGRLEIAPGEHGLEAIADHAAEPDELDAMPDEFARLAQRDRRNPDRGQEIAPEQEREALGVDAVVLEASGGDRLVLLRMGEDRLMAELLQEIDQPPPGPRGLDR